MLTYYVPIYIFYFRVHWNRNNVFLYFYQNLYVKFFHQNTTHLSTMITYLLNFLVCSVWGQFCHVKVYGRKITQIPYSRCKCYTKDYIYGWTLMTISWNLSSSRSANSSCQREQPLRRPCLYDRNVRKWV